VSSFGNKHNSVWRLLQGVVSAFSTATAHGACLLPLEVRSRHGLEVWLLMAVFHSREAKNDVSRPLAH